MNYKYSKESLKKLDSADLKLKELFIEAIKTCPIDITIAEAYRSKERQYELYMSKEKTGKWLTDKDGYIKKSKHQLRMAVDFVPCIKGKADWEYEEGFRIIGRHLEAVATRLNIEIRWGGRWKKQDLPHVELM